MESDCRIELSILTLLVKEFFFYIPFVMKQSLPRLNDSTYLDDTFFASDEDNNEYSQWEIFRRSLGDDENYRVHRVKHHSSSVFKVVFFLVTSVLQLHYWISIINQKNTNVSMTLCLSSAIFFLLSHACVTYVENSRSPESLVKKISSKLTFVFMIFSLLYSFSSIFFMQISWNLCTPILRSTDNHQCHHFFPEELVIYFLFLPIIYLLTHPNMCWQVTLAFYCTCVVVSLTCIVFAPTEYIPTILLSIILSFLCTFMVQVEVEKAFILYNRVQKQSDLRSEAKMAVQLRRMIGGVSHDLKSPLSALSLGLDNWKTRLNDCCGRLQNMAVPIGWEDNFSTILSCMQKNGQLLEMFSQVKLSMDKIIGRCIDANRIISGLPLLPIMSHISVHQNVQKILDMFQQENGNMCFQFVYDKNATEVASPSPQELSEWKLYTDPTWLEENLACLLGNAVKFGDYSEQKENIITLKITVADDFVRFSVIDNGQGVKDSTKATLFTFLGHDEQDSVGGSGLGLFTLACRVSALGGRYGYNSLTMEENSASGSEFWFELSNKTYGGDSQMWEYREGDFCDLEEGLSCTIPHNTNDHHVLEVTDIDDQGLQGKSFYAPDSYNNVENITNVSTCSINLHDQGVASDRKHSTLSFLSSLSSSLPLSPTKRPLHVLLVDDSLPIRKMCSAVLRTHNYTVVTMANGKDAVNYITSLHERLEQKSETSVAIEQDMDLILMDLQMPIMDGIEATRCIRNMSVNRSGPNASSHLPIIGMSACSDTEIISHAMATGMDAFLSKPFTMDQFQRCIAALNIV